MPDLFFEQLDVCLDELLEDFPNQSVVGDHFSDSGQLIPGNVDDSRLLPAILVGQTVCPSR